MSAIDWASVDWWDLPGPSRFLETAVQRIAFDEGGVVGLSLPALRPRRLIEALTRALEKNGALRVVTVNPSSTKVGRSPAHMLAAAAGASPGSIRSTADLLGSRDLANMIFIVDAVEAEAWSSWSIFLRSFRGERLRAGRITAPSVVIVAPRTLPTSEVAAVLGSDMLRWRSVVARADMQLYVDAVLGRPTGVAERTAAATIAEVACWDPNMVGELAALKLQDQIDPRGILTAASLPLGYPSWSNGLVDIMDGAPHVHTLGLLDSPKLLARRIWRAHVSVLFPAIEQVRQTFVRRYRAMLELHLPFDKPFANGRVRTFVDPLDLEIADVSRFLQDDIGAWECRLLRDFANLRTSMAHIEPAQAWRLVRASRDWETLLGQTDEVAEVAGWDWPRCGQRLVMLVGPSGAGKSTYAAANYPPEWILSSDAIREELSGGIDMAGSQKSIFETLRQRARTRLSGGQSVVIDATNLRQEDRLMNANIVPDDIPIDYVIIDRPMEHKVRDGGWRLEREGLLENHARIFGEEIENILQGDEIRNVTIIDRRSDGSST